MDPLNNQNPSDNDGEYLPVPSSAPGSPCECTVCQMKRMRRRLAYLASLLSEEDRQSLGLTREDLEVESDSESDFEPESQFKPESGLKLELDREAANGHEIRIPPGILDSVDAAPSISTSPLLNNMPVEIILRVYAAAAPVDRICLGLTCKTLLRIASLARVRYPPRSYDNHMYIDLLWRFAYSSTLVAKSRFVYAVCGSKNTGTTQSRFGWLAARPSVLLAGLAIIASCAAISVMKGT